MQVHGWQVEGDGATLNDGMVVGKALGLSFGVSDGLLVGSLEGATVGVSDGMSEGRELDVGVMLGTSDGCSVGGGKPPRVSFSMHDASSSRPSMSTIDESMNVEAGTPTEGYMIWQGE